MPTLLFYADNPFTVRVLPTTGKAESVSIELVDEDPTLEATSAMFRDFKGVYAIQYPPELQVDCPFISNEYNPVPDQDTADLDLEAWVFANSLTELPYMTFGHIDAWGSTRISPGIFLRKGYPTQAKFIPEIDKGVFDALLEGGLLMDEKIVVECSGYINKIENQLKILKNKSAPVFLGVERGPDPFGTRLLSQYLINMRSSKATRVKYGENPIVLYKNAFYEFAFAHDYRIDRGYTNLVFKLEPGTIDRYRKSLEEKHEKAAKKLHDAHVVATLLESLMGNHRADHLILREGLKGLTEFMDSIHIGDLKSGELLQNYSCKEEFTAALHLSKTKQKSLVNSILARLLNKGPLSMITMTEVVYRPIVKELKELKESTRERLEKELEEACST